MDYRAYELREGELTLINTFRARPEAPRELLVWLESIVSVSPDLPTDALTITQELGRDSTAYARASGILAKAWRELADDPEASLKRQLWTDLLGIVYGKKPDADALWFQHSYLTVVAKAFGFSILGINPTDPEDLLSGRSLAEAEIHGAIESDFFDWILKTEIGRALIAQLQRRVKRFRIAEVDLDVLKILYESLIDPEQRHDLGEYYTPDWLASRICNAAINDPVAQRVLDPACGSGSFLFHALRRFIAAAHEASVAPDQIAGLAVQRVVGMDIHPVAVIIARVTYLLALGSDLLRARRGDLSIPVYLGDALQWSVTSTLGHEELEVYVPGSKKGEAPAVLRFPVAVAADPRSFDAVIAALLQASEHGAAASDVEATLCRREAIAEADLRTLLEAYRELRKLQAAGRNHVWGYVARNITRPVWLSCGAQRFDRVIGNPPWLSWRYMSDEMQAKVRAGMDAYRIWVGGKVATHQDLSGYFFARCVDLYLNPGGRIAFLMPLAAMSRGQFEKFRSGSFRAATVTFTAAWTFDERVFPLFPVPSCALFAERTPVAGSIPDRVLGFAGILGHRNASPEEAEKRLLAAEEDAPTEASFQAATPYRKAFRNGATLFPRLFCYIERRDTGRIGTGTRVPIVSKRRLLEKSPWRDLPSVSGAIERQFLRPALLGESIAPYRVLHWPEAVVPVDGETLDAKGAAGCGYPGLAGWLAEAERLWDTNSSQEMTLKERFNYWGALEAQFPIQPLRVVYSKAGTIPAATILDNTEAVVENTLYWCPVELRREGLYLCAIINSETTRRAVEHLQARGQWGARHFDKVMFTLPIPRFKTDEPLHVELAEAGAGAEKVAAGVAIPEDTGFIRARQAIRSVLRDDGIAGRIDRLVARLLFHDEAAAPNATSLSA